MPRTLINMDRDDKVWLDREARTRKLPMTELVRRAIKNYRLREESHGRPTLQAALARTAGIWRQGDALAWQRRMRSEWDRPA